MSGHMQGPPHGPRRRGLPRAARRALCGAAILPIGAALLIPPALADVKAGVDAWSRGDFAGAVREWQPLADKGDPDAQFDLAQAYKQGRGVAPDMARAQAYYAKAAAQGHVQAADAYGLLLFQNGEREKAMPYIEASAGRGDPRAQYILGIAHFNGDLAPKDWVRAYALLTLAREGGLEQAARSLQEMDGYVPLAQRQEGVLLASRIGGEARATRQRLATAADLALVGEAQDGPGADFARAALSAPPAAKAPAPPAAPAAAASAAPKTPPGRETGPAAAPRPASSPAPAPAASSRAPRHASGPWRVQLGAFGVAGNAEALWARVRSRPELAGHDRALVPAGRLTKLQATGFASAEAANAACRKLSAAGFGCIPLKP